MAILVDDKFKSLASNMMRDVCVYILQKYDSQNVEFTTLRATLYSQYGQKTLIQSISNLSVEFFIDLESSIASRKINKDVFYEIVGDIVQKFNMDTSHAKFYETCGKIIILGLWGMKQESLNSKTVSEKIEGIAKVAYEKFILYEKYDLYRKNAHTIHNTVFKLLGTELKDYISPAELELETFLEVRLAEGYSNYIEKLKNSLNSLSSSGIECYEIMNKEKFLLLANTQRVNLFSNRKLEDFTKYWYYNVVIASLSWWSVNKSYTAGLQQGIEMTIEAQIKTNQKRCMAETI